MEGIQILVAASTVHLYQWCLTPWVDPWKWHRDFSIAQHISLGAVSVRRSCPLYYHLIENHAGFLEGCCQWCWTPGIWGWSLQGIFMQLLEVGFHSNCCSLSCLLCSCTWLQLMHFWGLSTLMTSSSVGEHLVWTEWIEGALCPVFLWWWFLVCSAAHRSVPAIFSSALTSLWGWMHCPCSGVVMCFVLMDHT